MESRPHSPVILHRSTGITLHHSLVTLKTAGPLWKWRYTQPSLSRSVVLRVGTHDAFLATWNRFTPDAFVLGSLSRKLAWDYRFASVYNELWAMEPWLNKSAVSKNLFIAFIQTYLCLANSCWMPIQGSEWRTPQRRQPFCGWHMMMLDGAVDTFSFPVTSPSFHYHQHMKAQKRCVLM